MFGPYEPGRGDRVLADFQAKLLARGTPSDDSPAEAKTRRVGRLLGIWALLVAAGALIAIVFEYTVVYLAIGTTLALILVAQVAMAIRRRTRRGDPTGPGEDL
jgi:hypothetical protein